ncbi:MAG: DUF1499 domain-containing protein [Bacteroidota bacterium]
MKKPVVFGIGLAILGTAGIVASYTLGSTPEEPRFDGPLPVCGDAPNCYRVRRVYSASPDQVREAARTAIEASSHWFTGTPDRVADTEDGLTAVFKTGPFSDDLRIAVVSGAAGQSVLHARSSSRVGESDLGVNRLRVRRLLAAIHDQLEAS